jgi:L-fuculose-phosphate aldolase
MDDLRLALIEAAKKMNALGINQGTSGNLSLREGGAMLITPSAMQYEQLTPDMIPSVSLTAEGYEGAYRPSSEWRFHRDIYRARPEIGAVVHNHAPYATALAMARREIPACHYMIARFGGAPVRVADYALFGTAELSAHVLAAMEGRSACLLANHGCIATGPDIATALAAAVELEALAKQYVLSLSIGGPVLLREQDIKDAITQFRTAYGPNIPREKQNVC